jgi:hypothetical protein
VTTVSVEQLQRSGGAGSPRTTEMPDQLDDGDAEDDFSSFGAPTSAPTDANQDDEFNFCAAGGMLTAPQVVEEDDDDDDDDFR